VSSRQCQYSRQGCRASKVLAIRPSRIFATLRLSEPLDGVERRPQSKGRAPASFDYASLRSG